jgi:hypothetical protein
MKGRILVDIPHTGNKSGDYAELDEKTASELIRIGAFDTQAPWPGEDAPAAKPRKPRTKKEQS